MISSIKPIDQKALVEDFLNPKKPETSFSNVFTNALDKVNELQLESQDMDRRLALGEIENVHDVAIKSQEAYLSLQIAVTVRNKLLEAYNEIMRMQI